MHPEHTAVTGQLLLSQHISLQSLEQKVVAAAWHAQLHGHMWCWKCSAKISQASDLRGSFTSFCHERGQQ